MSGICGTSARNPESSIAVLTIVPSSSRLRWKRALRETGKLSKTHSRPPLPASRWRRHPPALEACLDELTLLSEEAINMLEIQLIPQKSDTNDSKADKGFPVGYGASGLPADIRLRDRWRNLALAGAHDRRGGGAEHARGQPVSLSGHLRGDGTRERRGRGGLRPGAGRAYQFTQRISARPDEGTERGEFSLGPMLMALLWTQEPDGRKSA